MIAKQIRKETYICVIAIFPVTGFVPVLGYLRVRQWPKSGPIYYSRLFTGPALRGLRCARQWRLVAF